MPRTILVVPCYNEAERFDAARYCEFLDRSRDCELLLVNDGSTDGTLRVLRDLSRNNPERIGVFDLPRNVGKSEAVRQGMLAAFRKEPDFAGYWDADLATPLEAVWKMQRVLEGRRSVQAVLGSRVKMLGRRVKRRPLRHLLGRLFATSSAWLLNVGVYDTQCGAKLFRVGAQVEAAFDTPFRSRWAFDVELLARLLHDRRLGTLEAVNEALYELPLDDWHDVAGSKLQARHMLRAALDLFLIYRVYGRPRIAAPIEAVASGRISLEDTLPDPTPRIAIVSDGEERRAA